MAFNGFQIPFYAVQIRFDELMSFSVVEVITMIKCFKRQINLVNSFCCKRTAEVDFRLSALPGKAILHFGQPLRNLPRRSVLNSSDPEIVRVGPLETLANGQRINHLLTH